MLKKFIYLIIFSGLTNASAHNLRVIEGSLAPAPVENCKSALDQPPYVISRFDLDKRAHELENDIIAVALIEKTKPGAALLREFNAGRASELFANLVRGDKNEARIVLSRLSLAANDMRQGKDSLRRQLDSLLNLRERLRKKMGPDPEAFAQQTYARFKAVFGHVKPPFGKAEFIEQILKLSPDESSPSPSFIVGDMDPERATFVARLKDLYAESQVSDLNQAVIAALDRPTQEALNTTARAYLEHEEIIVDIAEAGLVGYSVTYRPDPIPRRLVTIFMRHPVSPNLSGHVGNELATWKGADTSAEIDDAEGEVIRQTGLVAATDLVGSGVPITLELRADRVRFRADCLGDCGKLREKFQALILRTRFATKDLKFSPVLFESNGVLWILGLFNRPQAVQYFVEQIVGKP